jgi:hypothetical protein
MSSSSPGGPFSVPLVGHERAVESVAFNPDGTLLATTSWDHTVRLWDPTKRDLVAILTGHKAGVEGVAFSPDGTLLATTSWDHTLRLWDVVDRQVIEAPLQGHSDTVCGVAFSPDGRLLATTSADRTVRLWDPERSARRCVGVLMGHTDRAWGVAFSPDGRLLATTSADGTVRLWDPADPAAGRCIGVLEGHLGSVWGVAFRPDGAVLASAGEDGKVRLWDPHTREPVGDPITGHAGKVWAVAYSPDGRLLVTTSWDKTVRLWDPDDGRPLGDPLVGHTSSVLGVAFSPDSRTVATASLDESVRLWSVSRDVEHRVHMVSDDPSEVDLLGFRREATQLARIFAGRATRPPLAMAVLGDWGSGKSTFMNCLHDGVAELCTEAEGQVRLTRKLEVSPYCPRIRQVRFNAWHYADDHVWTGLIRNVMGHLAADETVKTVKAAATARAEQERAKLDEEIEQVDEEIEQVDETISRVQSARRSLWMRALVVRLIGDERLVDGLGWGEQSNAGRYERRRRAVLALVAVPLVAVAVACGWVALREVDDRLRQAVAGFVSASSLAAVAVLSWASRLARLVSAVDEVPALELSELRSRRADLETERDALVSAGDPTERLHRFLEDRHATSDYDAYRGLVSLVHGDLEKLADLIIGQTECWSRSPDSEKLPLERVILYIDDLDRCDPATVVEALKAIHLLLTVGIFHVVVAVEPRWLLRCVTHHYRALLDDGEQLGDAVPPSAFSSIDYVEKIFQIAYKVPSMHEMVDGLIDEIMPIRSPAPVAPSSEPPAKVRSGGDPAGAVGGASPATVRSTPGTTIAGQSPVQRPAGQASRPEPAMPTVTSAVALPVAQRALDFTAEEAAAVRHVAGLLETPRSLKQLVNVYRVLRAVADAESRRHLDDEAAYVILLLAISCGHHPAAPKLLRLIGASPSDGADLRGMLEHWSDDTGTATNGAHPPSLADLCGRVRAVLDTMAERAPVDLETCRFWLPRVCRYSFRDLVIGSAERFPRRHAAESEADRHSDVLQ